MKHFETLEKDVTAVIGSNRRQHWQEKPLEAFIPIIPACRSSERPSIYRP
jgi:hypothetical protein